MSGHVLLFVFVMAVLWYLINSEVINRNSCLLGAEHQCWQTCTTFSDVLSRLTRFYKLGSNSRTTKGNIYSSGRVIFRVVCNIHGLNQNHQEVVVCLYVAWACSRAWSRCLVTVEWETCWLSLTDSITVNNIQTGCRSFTFPSSYIITLIACHDQKVVRYLFELKMFGEGVSTYYSLYANTHTHALKTQTTRIQIPSTQPKLNLLLIIVII